MCKEYALKTLYELMSMVDVSVEYALPVQEYYPNLRDARAHLVFLNYHISVYVFS